MKPARMQQSLFLAELQPFLKWAGGKRQLLTELRQRVPQTFNSYFEPFVGAGALFFDLLPQKARISDINEELINCYQVIKTDPRGLIEQIKSHVHSEDYFYFLRNLDRNPDFKQSSPVERAARTIFLNKTCFNGLFRVNSNGHFNVPYGKYKNPKIIDEYLIWDIQTFLNHADIAIKHEDFQTAVSFAKRGDFVYFDPPYDPLSVSSSFTGYNFKFDKEDQKRLKETFDSLDNRGCKVLLSNSATDFIRDLYRRYHIVEVSANRAINSVGTKRGAISELLVSNY